MPVQKFAKHHKVAITVSQAKKMLRKEQDILCASNDVHILWLSLALDMLIHGDTVNATIFSPAGKPTPKR